MDSNMQKGIFWIIQQIAHVTNYFVDKDRGSFKLFLFFTNLCYYGPKTSWHFSKNHKRQIKKFKENQFLPKNLSMGFPYH